MGCPVVLINHSIGWNPGYIQGNQTVTIPIEDYGVPGGASAAFLSIGMGTDAPAGAQLNSVDPASGVNAGVMATQVAGQPANGLILAPIDNNGNIQLRNLSGSGYTLVVWLLGYF